MELSLRGVRGFSRGPQCDGARSGKLQVAISTTTIFLPRFCGVGLRDSCGPESFEEAAMPRSYPAEFRKRAVELVRSGRPVVEVARLLEVSEQTIYNWRRQDRVDGGELAGITTSEGAELAAARRRIRELETELAIQRRAAELLKAVVPPKGASRRSR
jgi:transposase